MAELTQIPIIIVWSPEHGPQKWVSKRPCTNSTSDPYSGPLLHNPLPRPCNTYNTTKTFPLIASAGHAPAYSTAQIT